MYLFFIILSWLDLMGIANDIFFTSDLMSLRYPYNSVVKCIICEHRLQDVKVRFPLRYRCCTSRILHLTELSKPRFQTRNNSVKQIWNFRDSRSFTIMTKQKNRYTLFRKRVFQYWPLWQIRVRNVNSWELLTSRFCVQETLPFSCMKTYEIKPYRAIV
jgi:hypothetical protein